MSTTTVAPRLSTPDCCGTTDSSLLDHRAGARVADVERAIGLQQQPVAGLE
jgi:hypothetical protein